MRPALLAVAPFLAFLGPCFQLRISSDVTVERDGSMQRSVQVESTDAAKVSIDPSGAAPKEAALLVQTDPAFLRDTDATIQPGQTRWSRTRSARAGEAITDLTIRRRADASPATHRAVVFVDDFVLFQRLRYRETISDTASPASLQSAAREIGALLASILERAAEELLGAAYDLTDLRAWLRDRGQGAFPRLVASIAEAGSDLTTSLGLVQAALEAEGVILDRKMFDRVGAGEALTETDQLRLTTAFRDGAIQCVASLLKRKDATPEHPGAPIRVEELAFLGVADRVSEAIANAVAAKLGSKDAFNAALDRRLPDLFGNFGGIPFDPSLGEASVRWRTRVRMPGLLLRSNGSVLSDGSILWLLLSSDLALRATTMEAESFVLNESAITALGGSSLGVGVEEAFEVLAELGRGRERTPNPRLRAILETAVAGNPDAWKLVHKDGAFETVRRVFRMGL